jgi:glycosyltransferase involved in cell wall biosynthesis
VVLVVHHYPPHVGGMEEVAAAQATSLVARGHDVTVFTCAHAGVRAGVSEQAGVRVRRLGAINTMERRFGVTFPIVSPHAFRQFWQSISSTTVVHVHDAVYLSSQLAVLAAVLRRRPFYLTQHVAFVEHPSRLVMAVQRTLCATVGRAMFRRAERVVVYNARVRDFVLARGADPARVVMHHNGIDTTAFAPAGPETKRQLRRAYGLPVDRPVALFVGRLVPKKGFDVVIAAGCDAFTTLVVGDGAGARVRDGINVVMFGAATRAQLRDLYRLSDVFVFPTIGEPFTLVMQEAMAAGLPVVTTDDPAYRDADLDPDLIAFVERRPQAVRSAVLDVLSTPGRAVRMAEYARRTAVERFSWNANYHHEYAIYGTEQERSDVASAPR